MTGVLGEVEGVAAAAVRSQAGAKQQATVEALRASVDFLRGVLERMGARVFEGKAGGEAKVWADRINARIDELNDRIEVEMGDTLVIDRGRLVRWSRAEADMGFGE